MILCRLAFSQSAYFHELIALFSFGQNEKAKPLLQLAFSQPEKFSARLLALSFETRRKGQQRRFSGNQTQGLGDFDVRVFVSGRDVPMCQLAETMTITRAENASAICEFVLRPPHERKKPIEINLAQWYSRAISVRVFSDSGSQTLFSGWIDDVDYALSKGKIRLTCSDRRERRINALSRGEIEKIGRYNKSVHGDDFDTIKAELDQRMTTVFGSFEFDLNGRWRVNSWFAGRPNAVLSPCVIYEREPSLTLREYGGVTNVVDFTVSLAYPRWIQRKVLMNYDLGLNVCQYSTYGKVPTIQDVADAINQTGWKLAGFQAARLEKNGWYSCNGYKIGWLRDARVVKKMKDDNSTAAADVEVVELQRNFGVQSGTFELIRRWSQNITEHFHYRVQDLGSIRLYGEGKQTAQYGVQATSPDDLEWETPDIHSKKLNFEFDENSMSYAFYSGVGTHLSGLPVQKSEAGDLFIDWRDTQLREFYDALEVAKLMADVQILSTHRNQLNLQVKFMPTVDLTHTHEIQHSHVSGNLKVSRIIHQFDFVKKKGLTELEYSFFGMGGDGSSSDAPFVLPEMKTVAPLHFARTFYLGRVELGQGVEYKENQHFGMIYKYGTVSLGTVLWSPYKLVVKTPEVEEYSTKAREIDREYIISARQRADKLVIRL